MANHRLANCRGPITWCSSPRSRRGKRASPTPSRRSPAAGPGGGRLLPRPPLYHLKLRAYVVIEIKAGGFKPEHTGKLSFYLSAVDAQVKAPEDAPTIGLLLCKSKNRVVAEYALRDTNKPMGVAEYQLVEALPKGWEASLPSVEQIERELGEVEG